MQEWAQTLAQKVSHILVEHITLVSNKATMQMQTKLKARFGNSALASQIYHHYTLQWARRHRGTLKFPLKLFYWAFTFGSLFLNQHAFNSCPRSKQVPSCLQMWASAPLPMWVFYRWGICLIKRLRWQLVNIKTIITRYKATVSS